jgi:hypothetical protein
VDLEPQGLHVLQQVLLEGCSKGWVRRHGLGNDVGAGGQGSSRGLVEVVRVADDCQRKEEEEGGGEEEGEGRAWLGRGVQLCPVHVRGGQRWNLKA